MYVIYPMWSMRVYVYLCACERACVFVCLCVCVCVEATDISNQHSHFQLLRISLGEILLICFGRRHVLRCQSYRFRACHWPYIGKYGRYKGGAKRAATCASNLRLIATYEGTLAYAGCTANWTCVRPVNWLGNLRYLNICFGVPLHAKA